MYGAIELTGPLSKQEEAALSQLEEVIRLREAPALEAGAALAKIHDSRLYRSFGTWEEYLGQKLGIKRAHAHRLMEAARIAERLPLGDTIKNERQARELTGLTPETQRLVLERAQMTQDGANRLTAKAIRSAVQAVATSQWDALPAQDKARIVNRSEADIAEAAQVQDAKAERQKWLGKLRGYLLKAGKAAKRLGASHLEEEIGVLVERATGLK